METAPNKLVLRQVDVLFRSGVVAGLSDGQLLERFLHERREVADLAFAALVERHGPMVLRVCQAVLRNPADADDAFQATFLVLARRAGAVQRRESLASWLYGVALRVASCARAAARRRREHEHRVAEHATGQIVEDFSRNDVLAVIHEEIGGLPEIHRVVILLCHVEGLGCDDAARQLGWPVGTVKSRLARGRERLQRRLLRRGLAPAAVAGALTAAASPSVSAALLESTVEAVFWFGISRRTTAGVGSASVLAYAEGALRSMFFAKLKIAAGAFLAFGLLTSGAIAVAQQAGGDAQPQPSSSTAEDKSRAQTIDEARTQLVKLSVEVRALRAKLAATEEELERVRASLESLEKKQGKQQATPRPDAAQATDEAAVATARAKRAAAGAKKQPNVYQELVPSIYFSATAVGDRVAIVNTKTRKARTLSLPASPDAPLQIGAIYGFPITALSIIGPKVTRIAVFNMQDTTWHVQELRAPASGQIGPILGGPQAIHTVAYHIGRYIYAFGALANRWDVLKLPDGVSAEPTVGFNSVTVKYDGHVHEFDAQKGKWEHTDISALLDSILKESKPAENEHKD